MLGQFFAGWHGLVSFAHLSVIEVVNCLSATDAALGMTHFVAALGGAACCIGVVCGMIEKADEKRARA